jgi:hypothetical protein
MQSLEQNSPAETMEKQAWVAPTLVQLPEGNINTGGGGGKENCGQGLWEQQS